MTNVSFRAEDDPPGLEIRDRVSKRQFALQTSSVPELTPADTEPFVFPVEEACRVVTETVRVSQLTSINVRDSTGEQVAALNQESSERLPAAEYVLELDGQVKTYLLVDAPLEATTGVDHAELSFESPTAVVVGARARLRRPPTTVTTTRDLDDVRRAVETLSSSLQTTSPERSFPTLRGHPPRLEHGDELDVPEAAEPPKTGITLRVPRELSTLFTVAPLSYYLGASIAFGERFQLETDAGVAADLDERGVETVLQHVFLLDCLVRTHGLYEQKPVEYEALAPKLPLDLPGLYDASLAERTEAYLSVPTSVTEPYVPRWPSVAYVEPSVDRLEALPFLVDDLSLIRIDGVDRYRGEAARKVALSRFVTSPVEKRSASAVFEGRDTFVDVPETDARHRVWVGEGVPMNASKFVTAGYEHQVKREPTDRHQLRVTVVCNDPDMAAEASATRSRYRPYTDRQLTLDIYESVQRSELREIVRSDADFFHFIGHATEEGLECPDGLLDVATVPDVGFDSFLLNACQSYRQGVELVEKGVIGGIVTLGDVANDAAVETGSHLAQLLNGGLTLRNALSIARGFSVVGGQYSLVGDGRTTLQGNGNGTSVAIRISSQPDGYELTVDEFLNEIWRVGSLTTWHSPKGPRMNLASGSLGPFEATAEQLETYFETYSDPLWLDDEFYWSSDVTREDLG